MDILVAKLPAALDRLARVVSKLGPRVYYLQLARTSSSSDDVRRAEELAAAGVLPLPLEQVAVLDGALTKYSADPDMRLRDHVSRVAPPSLLDAFGELFDGVSQAGTKLRSIVQVGFRAEAFNNVALLRNWARANPDRRCLLVDLSIRGVFAFDLPTNCQLLVIPLEPLGMALRLFSSLMRRAASVFRPTTARQKGAPAILDGAERVAFVAHKRAGPIDVLAKSVVHYSEDPSSVLYHKNLLHIDYSGWGSPSPELKWVTLGRRVPSKARLLFCVVRFGYAWARMALKNRTSGGVVILMLMRAYLQFVAYLEQVSRFRNLRVAVIDYEILCPKPLLLAFEAQGVRTVAAQERFLFPWYQGIGTILDTYLCCSDVAMHAVLSSQTFCAKRLVAVGQYRTDKFHEARKLLPPQLLAGPLAEGRCIVTALGFDTHRNWHESAVDPLANWTAHRHFLADIIRLSKDIPNAYVVLRYKSADWMDIPEMSSVVDEIARLDNVTVSTDNSPFASYSYCAWSRLVVAKHTSLGDECLAIGIPVLFHEYTHNVSPIMAHAFDYRPTRIMCHSYGDLLQRATSILCDDTLGMAADYDYLKSKIYGNYADGRVRERIHGEIHAMLEDR